MTATDLIRVCSIYSIAGPMVAYIIKFRSLYFRHHILGLLITTTIFWEGMSMSRFGQRQSNALLFNAYFATMFLILSWFYYKIYFSNRKKNLFVLCSLSFAVATVLFSLFIRNFDSYQGELWALSAIFIIVYGILFAKEQPIASVWKIRSAKSSDLLVSNFAFFYYYSFNFFLFMVSDYVLTEMSPKIAQSTWAFHNVNNIIKNLLLAAAFFFVTRSPESQSSAATFRPGQI